MNRPHNPPPFRQWQAPTPAVLAKVCSGIHDESRSAYQEAALQGPTVKIGVASPHSSFMAVSPPITKTRSEGSGQLSREQVDALLLKLRDPSLARKFLMDAGLIDADGQLSPQYRSQDAQTA